MGKREVRFSRRVSETAVGVVDSGVTVCLLQKVAAQPNGKVEVVLVFGFGQSLDINWFGKTYLEEGVLEEA
jgi:hypothetical protein